MLLEWAAQSGVFNDADTVVTDTGDDGRGRRRGHGHRRRSRRRRHRRRPTRPTPRRSTRNGALLEGYTYKESTGVDFDAASESLQLVTQFPEISEDGRSLTATWDTFYVDYQTAGVLAGVPAHVVGQRAPSASRIRRRPSRR